MRLPFYSDCVSWPRTQLAALEHLVDNGEEITREDFMAHVDTREISSAWFPNESDWHIRYYRLRGARVYWYVHSATEIVFADPTAIRQIQEVYEAA